MSIENRTSSKFYPYKTAVLYRRLSYCQLHEQLLFLVAYASRLWRRALHSKQIPFGTQRLAGVLQNLLHLLSIIIKAISKKQSRHEKACLCDRAGCQIRTDVGKAGGLQDRSNQPLWEPSKWHPHRDSNPKHRD